MMAGLLGLLDFKSVIDSRVQSADTQSIEYIMGMWKGRPSAIIPFKIHNSESMSFIFDKGYLTLDTSDEYNIEVLDNIMDSAFKDGQVDVVRLVHQRCCDIPGSGLLLLKRYLPSLNILSKASSDNHHQLIRSLSWFNESPDRFVETNFQNDP
ncbi:hypothetical protein SAMD00019534_113730 [Acytostelium subglobosum LB1]|uniref:hypothetical protein n=1 Tax=Acytostelium subglobosum LB1 TaxID=1410327 RepID=UPI00064488D0|nr:hypothetical protein SAMD00019534_113730 [Acytostelium subglobosum LB1]GAM28197.1 hypothetical protein SAMD00019534_113730 [Acytostelium subglobosum LB1]|eukprot:XP_012748831.1 hypothetical protein SAMD00019534_113730 [Acytostelium subglobosum LB1]